ncbi:hypothetical protein [Terasakiella sp.]|uniref:hypothetical protein n=1 Tax=Terasakiella sp. TaxID=2034861 RepID=UPI003AA8DAFB
MKTTLIKMLLAMALLLPASVKQTNLEPYNPIDHQLELLEREIQQTRVLILITIKEMQIKEI